MVLKNSTEVWPTSLPRFVSRSPTRAKPKVYTRQKTSKQRKLTSLICASLLVSSLLALVALRTSQFRLGYELAALTQERSLLIERQKALILELAMLKRPKRIMSIVASKLSLKPATPQQIIRIRD